MSAIYNNDTKWKMIFEVYKTIDLGGGYKWAFKINKRDVVLSRTKKEAQNKCVNYVAMQPSKRAEAFDKLPYKEKDW